MGKNFIYLGSAGKQSTFFFRKFALKNEPMPPMIRIGPRLIYFWFLIPFIYIINIGQ